MFKTVVFFFILTFSFLQINASMHTSDTLRLYYDINVSTLSNSQLRQLDSLMKKNKSEEISSLKIMAYTDFLAAKFYNQVLSEKRAGNVKQYFITKGYSSSIKQCMGRGELPPELINQPLGIPENRKVEIIVQFKAKLIEQTKSVQLSEAKEGEHVILKNFNFQPGRHFLTRASQPELEILLTSLAENPTLKIEIQGHICCEYTGKDGLDQDTYSNDLSVNRAKYIYDYLVKNNISPERLQYKGFGSTKPLIFPEKTLEDQNKNRRVEIVIIKR